MHLYKLILASCRWLWPLRPGLVSTALTGPTARASSTSRLRCATQRASWRGRLGWPVVAESTRPGGSSDVCCCDASSRSTACTSAHNEGRRSVCGPRKRPCQVVRRAGPPIGPIWVKREGPQRRPIGPSERGSCVARAARMPRDSAQRRAVHAKAPCTCGFVIVGKFRPKPVRSKQTGKTNFIINSRNQPDYFGISPSQNLSHTAAVALSPAQQSS
jgi:hypothetical protein